jgi:hypothetical protein
MELNRGKAGVPLSELARVVEEAQKFFGMLADDVHIIRGSGEWVASDFDNEFLNFTAEFTGPVEIHQIDQFRAAFDGVTLLRRATIAQFARIASALGDGETIAFGLYRNDEEVEPGEWRSLSKREALRIESEIRQLLTQAGDSAPAALDTAALDTTAMTNLFGAQSESDGLVQRVARLEAELARHAEALKKMGENSVRTDQGLQRLMSTVDAFCEHATRQLERMEPPAPQKSHKFGWRVSAIFVVLCLVGAWWWFFGSSGQRPAESGVRAAEPAIVSSPPAPMPTAAPLPPRASRRIDLRALEPDWVTIYVDGKEVSSKLMKPPDSATIEEPGTVLIRFGRAGGVEVLADGKPIGPIGPKGQVAAIEFRGNGFRIVPPGIQKIAP